MDKMTKLREDTARIKAQLEILEQGWYDCCMTEENNNKANLAYGMYKHTYTAISNLWTILSVIPDAEGKREEDHQKGMKKG